MDAFEVGQDGFLPVGPVLRQQHRSAGGGRSVGERPVESALELQYETHFSRFLMPNICGEEKGSKKSYAGMVTRSDGSEELVYKHLATVRSDWCIAST